jgi:hypothetical protein
MPGSGNGRLTTTSLQHRSDRTAVRVSLTCVMRRDGRPRLAGQLRSQPPGDPGAPRGGITLRETESYPER